MFERLKENWRRLREGRPGARFQEARRGRRESGGGRRAAYLAVAVLLLVAGGVLMVIPGPGIPLVALGAGLLARESERVARGADRLELWIRRVAEWGLCVWGRMATPLRVLLVAVALAGAAALAWLGWRIFFGE